jgi:arylformamidase
MTFHDISVILGEQNATYPGDVPFERLASPTTGDFGVGEESSLRLSAHAGTHLDAPAHFFADRQRLDDFPVEHFLMPAQVVEILDPLAVRADDLQRVQTSPGEALLFRTGNSHSGRAISGRFTEEYVYIAEDAARWCVDRQLRLVGLDYISIDRYGDPDTPAHRIILGAGLLALEGVNLEAVSPGRYTLLCLPLRVKRAEGSPVRAVLMSESLTV